MTLPYGLASVPSSGFAWSSLSAMVVLGFLGTGWAFVAMTNLMGRAGAPRGSVAIYLTPVVAITLGVAFRDETVAGLLRRLHDGDIADACGAQQSDP